MRHLISMLLQNEAGTLARVAGLFASRGYNIESLAVAATHDANVSRLTLVASGDDAAVEQIIKQSAKLVDVIEIVEYTGCADEVDAFVHALRIAGDVVDHARSGYR
jgi:acetolactate synthase-1/3 small subunit